MSTPSPPPREPSQSLCVILFTDIVGSTRYFATRGDQAGLQMLERHNSALFPIVEQANGRIVKTIGDSIFAVFEKPADALRAAFAMQQRLTDLRAGLPEDEHIHIRVGVHYGLVTEKDKDVFGDAINLGERVKSQAEADQIFVSRTLRDLVRADPRFVLQSVGLRELKGATEPMELFLLTDAPALSRTPLWKTGLRRPVRLLRRHALATVVVMAVAAVALTIAWWRRPAEEAQPRAIAVLPLRNLNPDKAHDPIAATFPDVFVERLGAIDSLVVRPAACVQRYKDKDWEPQAVGKELKVDTLVAGTLLSEGENIRIHVEVIDVGQNRALWADSLLGLSTNALDLLKRLAQRLGDVLRLRAVSAEGIAQFGTDNPKAFALYLQGLYLQKSITQENNEKARAALEEAVRLDPKFADAHAALAQAYVTEFWWNFSNDRVWLERAEAEARRGVQLAPKRAASHYALAYAFEARGQRQQCIREFLSSFSFDRHYAPTVLYLARYSFYMGDFDRALTVLDRLAYLDPTENVHIRNAYNHYFAGRLEAAREESRLAEARAQGVDERTLLAFVYIWLNDLEAAQRLVDVIEKEQPDALSLSEIRAWLYTARGQYPQARAEMEKFSHRKSWGIAQEMAALYALQNDRQRSLEWLEKAYAMGAPSYAWFKSDHFKILRGDPRYEEILGKLQAEYEPVRAEFDRLLRETPF